MECSYGASQLGYKSEPIEWLSRSARINHLVKYHSEKTEMLGGIGLALLSTLALAAASINCTIPEIPEEG